MDDVQPVTVEAVREASRQMVRELGFLGDGSSEIGMTHAECHALIEIGRRGTLTPGEIATLLALEPAYLARVGLSPAQVRGFGSLAGVYDLRRTVDDLLGSVPPDELASVMREVVRHGGEIGTALLEMVMLDARTPHAVAVELIPLTRPTREGALLGKTAQNPLPTPHAVRRSGKAKMLRPSSPRSLLDALPVRRRLATSEGRAKPTHHDKLLPAVTALSAAQFDVAVELLTEVVTQQPEHHVSWLHLAVAHSALAQHRQAARCMRRAILLQSSRPHA